MPAIKVRNKLMVLRLQQVSLAPELFWMEMVDDRTTEHRFPLANIKILLKNEDQPTPTLSA